MKSYIYFLSVEKVSFFNFTGTQISKMKTLKNYDYIKDFAERPGALINRANFNLYTSYAVGKLRDDFFMHSTGLMKHHVGEQSVKLDHRFKFAKTQFLAKLDEFDARNSYRSEDIDNKLKPIKFHDVIEICPNCSQMRLALKKLDNCLAGPFNFKTQGRITEDEFNQAIVLPKQAWRDFIESIFKKPE